MNAPTVTLYNGRSIYARGTSLADVPADFQGVPWAVWDAQTWLSWAAKRDAAPPPATTIKSKAVSTARDGYGMRGMRGHSAPLLTR